MSEAYRSDETVTVDEPRESTPLRPATPEELKKWPRSIAFIMGNEGCERYLQYLSGLVACFPHSSQTQTPAQ